MQSYDKNLIKANKTTKTKAKNDIFGNFGVTGYGRGVTVMGNQPKGIVSRELAMGLREPNYQTISYYDIDKKDWRAFSVDSLVDITRFWSLKPQAVNEDK